ncbi:MAG: SusC/RagA family TonB-linked outer membrane protein [Bacteroidales bacterium]|jgi:TonB-linked SusC/RagA family outer membrane protein|nr:SusC/RagA family TonB-linked outer membrane protein [Bacteroidales bacterium]
MKKFLAVIGIMCLGLSVAIAQTVRVSGTVTGAADGLSLPGANVFIKGTTTGVVTDVQGRYAIDVPGGATLVFSYVGMTTREMPVGDRREINVALEDAATEIGEVVITGMSSVDKRLFTGATDQLKADDVRIDGLADVSRALEGRSAGVTVQNVSGTFGSAPKIRVRGATSIYGTSKPLWVVDGVIMEDIVEVSADALSSGDAVTLISSAIAGLNADDIESFQILKDGSATSIYGARAMPGVVVVTTKKGKAGTSQVNYSGEFTMRLKPSYRNFNIMNSQEQMGIYQELADKGWLRFAETFRASESGVYGKMYQLMNTYDPASGTFALQNTPEARARYLQDAEMRNTDWFDQLFSYGVMQNHSVSVSSGTEKSTSYASVSAMIDPGWYRQSSVNRYTALLNNTYNVLKNLSINIISNASYRKQNAPGTLSQDVDVVAGKVKRDFDINPYSFALNTSRTLDPNDWYVRNYSPFNIISELDNNYLDITVADLKFQGEVKWKIIPGLEVSALGAIKYNAASQEHNILDNSNQAMAYRAMGDATIIDNNPYLYSDPDKPFTDPISVLPQGGIYQRRDNKMTGYDFRATVQWNKVLNDTHIMNFFGGTEINAVDRKETFFNGWGLQYSMGETPFYLYQYFKKAIEDGNQYYYMDNTYSRSAAFFGNAAYSWKGKYALNGTLRYEGTNGLGKSRRARWLPTWNISGAWNMHEEEFFKLFQPVLSHFTMRTSYSLTGDRVSNENANSLAIIRNYTPWRPFAKDQESGMELVSLENSELTYEKKHELNIGFDFGFLNNRLNLVTDVFWRNNFDLIGPINTQGIGGEVTKFANVAEMKSSGVEFTVSSVNITGTDFSWNTDFIFAFNKTKITKMETERRIIDLITGSGFGKEDYPARALFSIPFLGLNEQGLPTFLDENGERSAYGPYFQERQKIDFLTYEGPTDPTVSGSLGNIVRYKNWRLNLFFTYSFGNKIRLDPVFAAVYSDLASLPREFKNRWMLPGDENITNIPTLMHVRQFGDDRELAYGYSSYNYSDVRAANGGFIRMKEVSLSYDFPAAWAQRIHARHLSLKMQGTNLFLLYADSKLNGQDPEFFRSGGVAAPVPKQFTLTLKLGF